MGMLRKLVYSVPFYPSVVVGLSRRPSPFMLIFASKTGFVSRFRPDGTRVYLVGSAQAGCGVGGFVLSAGRRRIYRSRFYDEERVENGGEAEFT